MWLNYFFFGILPIVSQIYSSQEVDQGKDDFAKSNREFAAAVYKELAKSEKDNFITCPLSVQTVMALTSTGAKGITSAQISRGLNLPVNNTEATQSIFRHLSSQLRGNEFYSLTSANKLFVHRGFKINKEYLEQANANFNAEVGSVDFTENFQAAANINEWVQKKTNNKIRELVAPDDLRKDTKLVLANALHFRGKWKIPFDVVDTIKRPFYTPLAKEPVSVDMMQLTDFFNYYDSPELDAKFLELPYQGDDISMIIVLPNKVDGLKELENRMNEVLKDHPFTRQHVRVQFPKFSMETTTKYKPILQKLGIEKVFTPDADLSGITPNGNILINSVLQKTFINVTETGTEAAAATAGSVLSLSIPSRDRITKLNFVADHPFFFYLALNNNVEHLADFRQSFALLGGMPLFMGRRLA